MSINNVSMTFGGPLLLDNVSFQIEEGQRICIVGRNGEGKSTLLRLLSGDLTPDSGTISTARGITVARLSQKVPEKLEGTIFEVVAGGLGSLGETIAAYHRTSLEMTDDKNLSKLAEIEEELQNQGGWEALRLVETIISKLSLTTTPRFETLSGGLKRRTLLARALAGNPDVLLLDEPTNHLDIDSISWLEEFILRHVKTLVFITHDRMFLRKVATRIIELDRGNLADWTCDYDTFLKHKEELLAAEEKTNSEFDKKLAREEVWIRQGIKARRTRNEGRVRALKKMRDERMARREKTGKAKIAIQEAQKSGKVVAEAIDISFGWDGKTIFKDFSTLIVRGDRVGIIGPNGAGKTTLIQALLGEIKPHSGQIKLGTKLEISYFDQHREQLDPDSTVRDCIADGNDTVTINGVTKHVIGYLKDFLFSADRANSPVRVLSGGERNRLLLARLFTRPSNLLVMDEPTNDLDAETLELLEDRIMEYPGTVIIVSHDRAFLNNVVSSTIAFEGNAVVNEYVGGYDDWLRQRPEPEQEKKDKTPKPKPTKKEKRPEKLSYKEQREKEALSEEIHELPIKIEKLESGIEEIHNNMSQPEFYKQEAAEMADIQNRLEEMEKELEQVYERWEYVEAKLEEYAAREK
ncbi:ATP-binding cassette domain-containing protein [Maridesulfovibrio bastinii]|uniref:ATP-binding cassette domain-containing protein n=1 Tax=Maridesulfovibrio bastinii TaxID=47157 RepID=UPI003CCBA74A